MQIEDDLTDDVVLGRFFKITLVANPDDELKSFKSQETPFYESMDKAASDMEYLTEKLREDYPECKVVPRELKDNSDIIVTYDVVRDEKVLSKLTLWMFDHNDKTKH